MSSRKEKNKFPALLIKLNQEDWVQKELQEGDKSGNVTALIKKNVIRRTFKSKKNAEAPLRQKSPKIQRLVTDVRIRRKRIQKDRKIKKWKKTIEQQ